MAGRKPKPTKLALDVCEFIESHLRIGEGGHRLGEPFELLAFQKEWISKTFRNPRPSRSILSTGRKNGKTATVAAIVCAALLGPLRRPGGQIISASMSREQAAIIFRYAVRMLRVSGLAHLVTIRESKKEIEHGPTGTTFRAISAQSSTAHGLSPYLVLFDELGQARGERLELFDALATAGGAYEDFLMIVISTQAASDSQLLSVLIDDALSGADPRTVVSLHAGDPEKSPWSVPNWKKANPAMGVFRSRQDVENQAAEAKRLPARENAFANLILNLRVSAEESYLTAETMKINQGEPSEEAFLRGPVFGGLDLSSRQDLTSLVLCCEDAAGKIHVRVYAWTPAGTMMERARRDRAPYDLWVKQEYLRTTPGVSIAWDFLAQDIGRICSRYPVERVNYDRWRIEDLRREFDAQGIELPLEGMGQGFRSMGPAMEIFTHHALRGDFLFGNNPVLNWTISNAVLDVDPSGAGKLSKKRSFGRIDPAVALAMAIAAMKINLEPQGLIESEGMLFI
jgi:phage terminase large subunit-like protein